MAPKIENKNILLSSLLDDSNRLAPFTLTIFDDLATTASTAAYMRHLIHSYTNGDHHRKASSSKQVTVLCLQTIDKEKFVQRNRITLNRSVTLVTEDDLFGDEDDTEKNLDCRNNRLLERLVGKRNSISDHVDNVLIIDSLIPIWFASQDGNNHEEPDVERATKAICRWLVELHTAFSHIVSVLHTDFTHERYVELALSNISTAIIDFRLNSGRRTEKQLTCPLITLTNDSFHAFVSVRKKHPRTHWKATRQHEHFAIDSDNGDICRFFSDEELREIFESNKSGDPGKMSAGASETRHETPQSTFRLTLKKDEQEAKDDLILPYIRKNKNTKPSIDTNAPKLMDDPAAAAVINPQMTIKAAEEGAGAPTKPSSQVIYHYDRFDDFDEDDPDDDLDF